MTNICLVIQVGPSIIDIEFCKDSSDLTVLRLVEVLYRYFLFIKNVSQTYINISPYFGGFG